MSDKKTPPSPVGKGRYALYQTPEGDGVLVYRDDAENTDSQQVIPRGLWQLLLKGMRGEPFDMSPMTLMKIVMGGG